MIEKFGIFLVCGTNVGIGNTPAIAISKLQIGDFATLEDAASYLRTHQINPPHFIMQYWVRV